MNEVEHFIWHAVRSRADDEADDLGVAEGLGVDAAEFFDGGVGVGGRLEVRQKVFALAIAELHPLEAVINLVADADPGQPAAGAEAPVVAESAAAEGYRAVDIGAGKTGIDADFLDAATKSLAQVKVARIIGKAGGAPGK